MMKLTAALRMLDSFRPLPPTSKRQEIRATANREYDDWLSHNNGAVAYGGALRIFPLQECAGLADVQTWNARETWKGAYGSAAPDLYLFAEDAFGVQFGFEADGSVARFWNETGDVEALDLGLGEFFEAISLDPEGTISAETYRAADRQIGPLTLREHFAMRVETAVGGKFNCDNMIRMDSIEHMRACGSVAQQIRRTPIGTSFKPRM